MPRVSRFRERNRAVAERSQNIERERALGERRVLVSKVRMAGQQPLARRGLGPQAGRRNHELAPRRQNPVMGDGEKWDWPEMNRLHIRLSVEEQVEEQMIGLVLEKRLRASGKELHSVGGAMLILLRRRVIARAHTGRPSGDERNDAQKRCGPMAEHGIHVALWRSLIEFAARRQRTGGMSCSKRSRSF